MESRSATNPSTPFTPSPTPRHPNGLTPSPSQYRSQCPSPTPLFQQLYVAVAHWERVLADSPELPIERNQIVRDLERLPAGKLCHTRDADSDYDDEEGSNDTASPLRSRLDVFGGGTSGSAVDRLMLQKNCLKLQTSSSGETKDR